MVKSMIDQSLNAAIMGSEEDAAALSRADDDVDTLYEAIIKYLGKLSQMTLINPQAQELQDLIGIANYLENIGDVVEKDLLVSARKRMRMGLSISESTITELRALADEVGRAFDQALIALDTGDPDDAVDVFESKKTVMMLAEETLAHIVQRLTVDEPNRVENFQLESDVIETYKRFNTLTRRIARLAVESYRPDPHGAAEA